ncbi:hypothetical protein HOY80DRAFT_1001900 [Tuber brumale]|nr:hypothetical protein HOY80DRAFT_1001900 [Tuber brumale]
MSTNQATAILYTIRSFSAMAKIQVCLTYELKHTTLKCWMLKLTLLYAGTIICTNPSQLPFSPFLTIISIHRNCTELIVFNLRQSKTASSCVTPSLPSPISRASINSTHNSQFSPRELCLILYLLILHWLSIYSQALSKIYHEMLSTAEFRTELNLTGRGGTIASRRYRDVRKFIVQKSRERSVTSKRQAGEDEWKFEAKFHSPHTGPFANFHCALDSLIVDVLKKAAESRRAARMNSDDEGERSVAGHSGGQPEAVVRPPPTIYDEKAFKIIYNETTAAPQGTAGSLPWIVPVGGLANRNWLGVLKHYTLQELGEAILGILEDIQPVNTTRDGTHQVELIADDQVNAWLLLLMALRTPLFFPPNTPLARCGDRCLEPGQLDVAKFYTEPASDSELEDDLAHGTKCWKGFPRSDGGWRRRIQTNDRRVLRFQNHSHELISRARINQGPNYMSSYGDLNGHVLPLPPGVPPPGCDAP